MRAFPAFVPTLVALLMISSFVWAQPIGEVDVAGTTYNSSQHSGTCGRMVSVDSGGFVHVAWMNSLTGDLSTRHAYYNVWGPVFRWTPRAVRAT
jgi:hypothetical protein